MGIYKRGVVISGVVSLTMGNSVFPFGDCLSAHPQGFRDKFLGHFTAKPIFLQKFSQRFSDDLFFLSYLSGIDIFLQGSDNETQEVNGYRNHSKPENQIQHCGKNCKDTGCTHTFLSFLFDGPILAVNRSCRHQLSRNFGLIICSCLERTEEL